ncbi:MAG: hypothetical protein IPK87_05450 [Planctomycetes bacterium]|nr:hypothetical protein [Planctomycetota bacterium]
MNRRRINRGFTLIELTLAMVGSIILIMGMYIVMVMLYQGLEQSADFADATTRVDLVRQLSFDARTAEELMYPTSDLTAFFSETAVGNGSGYYAPTGGFHGHRAQFRAVEYDPGTEASTRVFITWESYRSTGVPWTDPCSVRRISMPDTNEDLIPNDAWEIRFDQSGIELFTIRRTSNNNFNVDMESVEDNEVAHVQLAVTLRNVN